MPLLSFKNVQLSYGHPPLLEGVSFSIDDGERLCLVGRNGMGKSTLLKMIDGRVKPDDGEIVREQGLRVATLAQEVPNDVSGTVFDVIAAGLDDVGQLIAKYHELTHRLATDSSDALMNEWQQCQTELEAKDGWTLNQRVETIVSKMNLDADALMGSLSGGMKRRVLLGQALVTDPQLLLLDEPTNHLDIESILWLEDFLLSWQGAVLFITHDRAFLQKLATRIIEIDRGQLSDWPGDYKTYLQRKQEALDAEEKQNALFDKKLAQEETWIRQGIKARRTRNEGRVRALKKMRAEFSERRKHVGQVKLQTQDAEKSGKIVAEAEDLSFSYDDKIIVRDFSTLILRGDKIGLIGPNGVGKTTLLKLLLGQLEADSGKLKLGTKMEVAYFDQYRSALDEEKTVQENIVDGRDHVEINGSSRHVLSYLQDFLFTPQRARQKVKALSGGERNRLLLARLFTRPANVLVLDEPTNDLDADTLDLLEELLLDYQGTVLLVSHDRAFLDNVVTSTLAYEGDGRFMPYVGGYEDWLRQRSQPKKENKTPVKKSLEMPLEKKAKKLSYKDQRELDALPELIERLESEQAELTNVMGQADFYQGDAEIIKQTQARFAQVEQDLAHAYTRWDALEG